MPWSQIKECIENVIQITVLIRRQIAEGACKLNHLTLSYSNNYVNEDNRIFLISYKTVIIIKNYYDYQTFE